MCAPGRICACAMCLRRCARVYQCLFVRERRQTNGPISHNTVALHTSLIADRKEHSAEPFEGEKTIPTSFAIVSPCLCRHVYVTALSTACGGEFTTNLRVCDLRVWFSATMMDDIVIRISPLVWRLSYLAVKVSGYWLYDRKAT